MTREARVMAGMSFRSALASWKPYRQLPRSGLLVTAEISRAQLPVCRHTGQKAADLAIAGRSTPNRGVAALGAFAGRRASCCSH